MSDGEDLTYEAPKGVLFVVSTPIGNLDDITFRAVDVLKKVDFIACEDTRHSRVLLEKLQIHTKTISVHRFTERKRAAAIVHRLVCGESCALICDSGTPTISDPGRLLVNEAHDAGVKVVPIPGASAIMTALSVSGIDCSTFYFRGFIPRKTQERIVFFEEIGQDPRPAVMFESPKRIVASLQIAQQSIGDRMVVLTRELTKMHEEIMRGTAAEIADKLGTRDPVLGEICLVVGPGVKPLIDVDVQSAVQELINLGFTGKRLADEAQKRYGIKKSLAYRVFLELNG